MLDWKAPLESSSWPCPAHPQESHCVLESVIPSKHFLNSAGVRAVTTSLEEFAILQVAIIPSCKWHKHHTSVGLHTSFHLAWSHKKKMEEIPYFAIPYGKRGMTTASWAVETNSKEKI